MPPQRHVGCDGVHVPSNASPPHGMDVRPMPDDRGRRRHDHIHLLYPYRRCLLSGAAVGTNRLPSSPFVHQRQTDRQTFLDRTLAFSQVHGAVLLSELISIPLGSSLIALNPWIPLLGAIGFMAVATLFALIFVPNFTAPIVARQTSIRGDTTSASSASTMAKGSQSRLSDIKSRVEEASQWINRDVLLILGAFLICQLARQVSGVLLQYARYKFDWEYAKVWLKSAAGRRVDRCYRLIG